MMDGVLAVLLAAAQPVGGPQQDGCASATAKIDAPCTMPVRISPAAADSLLRNSQWAWWLRGDTLTLIARPRDGTFGRLCCAIQKPLQPIAGTTARGVSVRIPQIDRALIDIAYSAPGPGFTPVVYRSPGAPPAPARADPMRGSITHHQIDSSALGEARSISVYVPPGLPEGAQVPVIYLADGATFMYAPLLEELIATGRVRPAVIVGIDTADGPASGCAHPGHCDRRNLEYLPHFSAEGSGPDAPFGRHLRFVMDEVIPFIERIYPVSSDRDHRIAAGFSSGGVWAVSAAARRPDIFDKVLAMSPGGQGSVGDAALLGNAQLYLGAGLFEPTFLRATRERAALAREAGAEVRFHEMVSGHTHAMWEILFTDAMTWFLPQGDGQPR